MPGVSKSTIWPSGRLTTARMRLRVVCGLSETIATFWPTRRLTSVDLPDVGPAHHGHEARARRLTAAAASAGFAAEAHAVDALALGVHHLDA